MLSKKKKKLSEWSLHCQHITSCNFIALRPSHLWFSACLPLRHYNYYKCEIVCSSMTHDKQAAVKVQHAILMADLRGKRGVMIHGDMISLALLDKHVQVRQHGGSFLFCYYIRFALCFVCILHSLWLLSLAFSIIYIFSLVAHSLWFSDFFPKNKIKCLSS